VEVHYPFYEATMHHGFTLLSTIVFRVTVFKFLDLNTIKIIAYSIDLCVLGYS
jgi:hypothetical protein